LNRKNTSRMTPARVGTICRTRRKIYENIVVTGAGAWMAAP
jgi:hypothetical protein